MSNSQKDSKVNTPSETPSSFAVVATLGSYVGALFTGSQNATQNQSASSQDMQNKFDQWMMLYSKSTDEDGIPLVDSSKSVKGVRLKFYKTVNQFYDELPDKNFHTSELDRLLGEFQKKLNASIGNDTLWNNVITTHKHLLKWIDSAELAIHYAKTLVKDKDYIIDENSTVILMNHETHRLRRGERFREGVHELLEARIVSPQVPAITEMGLDAKPAPKMKSNPF